MGVSTFVLASLATNTTWLQQAWKSSDIYLSPIGTSTHSELLPTCAIPHKVQWTLGPITHLLVTYLGQPQLLYCPTAIVSPHIVPQMEFLPPEECAAVGRPIYHYACHTEEECYPVAGPAVSLTHSFLLMDLQPPHWWTGTWTETVVCEATTTGPLFFDMIPMRSSDFDTATVVNMTRDEYTRRWLTDMEAVSGRKLVRLESALRLAPLRNNRTVLLDNTRALQQCWRLQMSIVHTIYSPAGQLPVAVTKYGCLTNKPIIHKTIGRSLQELSSVAHTSPTAHIIQVELDLPRITLSPSSGVTWTLAIGDFYAESSTGSPVSLTIPLQVWESQRSATVTGTSLLSGLDRFDLILPEPSGCDLYGCTGCQTSAPRYCGPLLNRWIFGILTSILVIVIVLGLCVCMPWIYSSWKVGSGIVWILLRILLAIYYAILAAAGVCFFCKRRKEQSRSQSFQDHLDRLAVAKRQHLATLEHHQRTNAARHARRMGLLPALLLVPGVGAQSCSSQTAFVVPMDVCQTDASGVKSCSLGVSGRVTLSGPKEIGCMQAVSETGAILAEIQLHYEKFECISFTDLQFWSAPYRLDKACCRCCPFTAGCKGSNKCIPGSGPNGLPDDYQELTCFHIHQDMAVRCKQFDGCAWNGCGACNNQCSWCTIYPMRDGDPYEVARLGQIQCSAVVTASSHNVVPEMTQTVTLVTGTEKKLDHFILKLLGTYDIGEVWGGPETVILQGSSAALTWDLPATGGKKGSLGDLTCATEEMAAEAELHQCRASVDFDETAWSANNGISISSRDSWGHASADVTFDLPYRYGKSEAKLSSAGVIMIVPSTVPAVEISLLSLDQVHITVSVGDVCPQAAFDSVQGFSGAQGATLLFTIRGTCKDGFISVTSNDPHMTLSPTNLYVYTQSQQYAIRLETTVTALDFIVTFASLDTSVSVPVTGTLLSDSPVLPQLNYTQVGGSPGAGTSSGFHWPWWGTFSLTLGGLTGLALLVFCCCGCGWLTSCFRPRRSGADIHIRGSSTKEE